MVLLILRVVQVIVQLVLRHSFPIRLHSQLNLHIVLNIKTGDSGGPLVYNNGIEDVQVGITSWGPLGCQDAPR